MRDDDRTSLVLLLALVAVRFGLHLAFGGNYGFHRDELATIDDARYLAAGYVAYPPVTPLVGRVALELFGPSVLGFRFFAALAQAIAMFATGLMARELGASRFAQAAAAVAAGIAPLAMMSGVLFQYVAFDYLWWVLIAYCAIRLLRTDDPRWWLAIGALIGLGMLTKYTMGILVLGIVAGVFFTPLRRHLRSPWLWLGALLSVAVFSPNLLWQIRHDFVSLEFLEHIHARDVRIGRTDGFLADQFLIATSILTVPLWVAGLWYFAVDREGGRFRTIAWMFVVPLVLFIVMKGRGYYMSPAYPMLFAGGAVMLDRWIASGRVLSPRLIRAATAVLLLAATIPSVLIALPVGPVNSPIWKMRESVHREFHEQLGWEELTETVAGIWATIPEAERRTTAIFTGNYGEAGAVNMYRGRYGLPEALSGTNSYWYRGPGSPSPRTLIMLGVEIDRAREVFEQCDVAARLTNRYGVENEETRKHADVLLCRGPRVPLDVIWPEVRGFG